MPFELNDEKFTAKLFDQVSGESVRLIYKRPPSKLRLKFNSAVTNLILKHKGSKNSDVFLEELEALQVEYADKILVGFAEGDITLKGKVISSVEGKENYYDGWRSLVKEKGEMFLRALGELAFGNVRHLATEGDERPFVNSSETTSAQV